MPETLEPRRFPLVRSKEPGLVFPFELPEIALNRYSVGLFNTLYYGKQREEDRKRKPWDYEPFFYPLDKVLKWNRMYGKKRPVCSSSACFRGRKTSTV